MSKPVLNELDTRVARFVAKVALEIVGIGHLALLFSQNTTLLDLEMLPGKTRSIALA
jgi:hypothetical protein